MWGMLLPRLLLVIVVKDFLDCNGHVHGNLSMSEEKLLIKSLIDSYSVDGRYGRPVKAMNTTLKVSYGISLVQVMDLNEKYQVLTTNVWCKYKWRDESLHWHPLDHENITTVRVPINTIWKPDFVLYNYADERLEEYRHAMALVDPFGNVTYIPPAIFKSTCFIDTTYFPFDEQSCHLKFGSWTYNGNALDLFFFDDKEYIELSDYMPSQGWIILEHSAQKHVAIYDCCPNEPYPDLTFYLKLRRRATFYGYTLILPCVLLSFITMVLFMLPPETPAKMVLGINIFVAFFMLLLLLQESTPPTAKKIPILGAYYCFNMVMTTVSTFLCAIIVEMHYRADKRGPPGRWITFIFIEVMARALFLPVAASMTANLRRQYKRKMSLSSSKTGSNCKDNASSVTYGSIGNFLPPRNQSNASSQVWQRRQSAVLSDDDERAAVVAKLLANESNSVSNTCSPFVARRSCYERRQRSPASARMKKRRDFSLPLATVEMKPEKRRASKLRLSIDEVVIEIMDAFDSDQPSKRQYYRKSIASSRKGAETPSSSQVAEKAWRLIAMVLDRVFFFCYMISMVFSLTTLFPLRPRDSAEGLRFPNGTLIADDYDS